MRAAALSALAAAGLLACALAATVSCAPTRLTVVNQPITCDCPRQTAVFAGTFDSGGVAGGPAIPLQLLLETMPGKIRMSFVVPGQGAVCTLIASQGGSIDGDQECGNPSRPEAKIRVSKGSLSYAGEGQGRVQVIYDWSAVSQGAPAHATFGGTRVVLPEPRPDRPLLCARGEDTSPG